MPAYVDRIVQIARNELGVHEVPDGSNLGPRVQTYQAVTGGRGYPWCVSFCQWVLKQAGIGPVANDTAGVYYLLNYARKNSWVVLKPVPGNLVCFIHGAGHIGLVVDVAPDRKSFTTIEGNASNAVRERQHSITETVAFVRIPGEVQRTKLVTQLLPRFEVATSENGHATVLLKGKWGAVSAALPKLLVKHHTAKLTRTVVKVQKRVPA